jgi:type VI secretion system protein ImpF
MAELTSQDRLQPALIDRLTDEDPGSRVESRDRRVMSMRRLRECVLRDLSWLLNTAPLSQVQPDLADFPHAQKSTLDYGLRDLAGTALSGVDPGELERRLKQVILDFEPRILRRNLRVRTVMPQDAEHRNSIAFEIEGELWAQPVPMRLYLKSELDLEDGSLTVVDRSEGAGA